jgi:signal transduction histidine kinase/ActR/RegA family two-component response regulator
MSQIPALSPDEFEAAVRTRTAELLRTNEALRDQNRQLRQEFAALSQSLKTLTTANESDRNYRRAALNLMEDAVKARQAGQIENAERRRVEDELRDASRRKDEFLATLAHELRNPLAPIRNSLHILRMASTDGAAAERIYEILERQVDHLVRLVDDLLEVSRITRGKIEMRKEPIALAAVLRNALEASKPHIETARHRLAISLPAEPIIVDADPVRLAQVFTNLLNNAAKYTPEVGQLWLTVRRDDAEVAVSIRDSGVGIAAESLPRVFDLFSQVDPSPSRTQGGLGIGLTLVRTLVDAHGGNVEARSAGLGCGSEFVVRLPVVHDNQGTRGSSHRHAGAGSIANCRILVVDDNRDAADSLRMLLRFLGAEVAAVNDGKAALEALRTYRPSVILLDIGMPGMDGYEVARRMRQQPEGRDITLVALTGWGQDKDRRQSKEAGFDHHLTKPLEIDTLQELLSKRSSEPTRAGGVH